MTTFCQNCQTQVQTRADHETNSLICTQCYGVLEQNEMVSDVTFVESSGGRKGVIGQLVRTRQAGDADHFDWAGREALIANVTENMRTLGEQVNVRDVDTLDLGVRVYKLALERKFVRGRARDVCVAISLYAACRMQRKPVMIIDFSELLKKDLFLIGHAYLQMAFHLDLKLPLVDPALYLERFASQLDFEEKFADVVRTAAKLASRMNREWMVQGRRPAGISAASLIVAARIHGFNRSTDDVMTVVRMSSATIQKRLEEFARTSVASLTPEQFDVKSEVIKEEAEPPSYTAGAARRKRRRKELKRYEMSHKQERRALKESESDHEAAQEEHSDTDSMDLEEEERLTQDEQYSILRNGIQNDEEDQDEDTHQAVIEIDEDDVQAVNDLFDDDDIQELDEDFTADESIELHKHRFKFKNPPLPQDWVMSTSEVMYDESLSDDDEVERMIASDSEYRIRKRIWNDHFGNVYKELKRKRREKSILDEGREAKRKKKVDDGEEVIAAPWDAGSTRAALQELMMRRRNKAANKLFDGGLDLESHSDEEDNSEVPTQKKSLGAIQVDDSPPHQVDELGDYDF